MILIDNKVFLIWFDLILFVSSLVILPLTWQIQLHHSRGFPGKQTQSHGKSSSHHPEPSGCGCTAFSDPGEKEHNSKLGVADA